MTKPITPTIFPCLNFTCPMVGSQPVVVSFPEEDHSKKEFILLQKKSVPLWIDENDTIEEGYRLNDDVCHGWSSRTENEKPSKHVFPPTLHFFFIEKAQGWFLPLIYGQNLNKIPTMWVSGHATYRLS